MRLACVRFLGMIVCAGVALFPVRLAAQTPGHGSDGRTAVIDAPSAEANNAENWADFEESEFLSLASGELKRRPAELQERVARIDQLFESDRLDEALCSTNAEIESHPHEAMFYAVRAWCHRSRGDGVRELSDWDQAFRLDPSSLFVRFLRASALREHRRSSQALLEFKSMLGDRVRAPVDAMIAQTLIDQGRFDEAAEFADLAVKHRPNDPTSYSVRSTVRFGKNRGPDSLADATKAIELSPQGASHWGRRAVLRAELMQDLDGAVSDAEQALALSKSDVQRAREHWGLGMIAYRRGKFQAATERLDQAVRLDPIELKYRTDRAEALFKLRRLADARNDWDQAISSARQGTGQLSYDLTLAQLHRSRATVNLFLGDQAAYEADRAEAERLDSEEASKEAGKP